ncbi:MAG TPA: phenylalanine--tRNA ligase beta subunit-related protein [Thermoanaerobaculaceae bacterium]|nr:phenylalanine--tRNA ligase beta subunit-related protein [Thermoanaerobaculaceae bacterium]HRS16468.1 phenylalanine--tRNA ligase beta subunit-related protein [Thermoanaerobaculaceae bacterium]
MIETLPAVRHDLPGWTLFWARWRLRPHDPAALARVFAAGQAAARGSWTLETLAQQPTVAAVRALFRQAGCDPTRYRPSSEALLRRVLKGDDLPPIHPAVDVNNLLSIALAVPACVVDPERVTPPLVLRVGRAGERMQSMRGDFDLAGKPLLEDAEGPFGTPITDSERVKIRPGVADVVLVAYLPTACDLEAEARATLRRLLDATGVGSLVADGVTV